MKFKRGINQARLCIILCGLTLLRCTYAPPSTAVTADRTAQSPANIYYQEKDEMKNLIRQMMMWVYADTSLNLLPLEFDSKDSVCKGFDMDRHEENLRKLIGMNFFSPEFIENYDQIIKTLDQGIKAKKYEPWMKGELPNFPFANDVDPWCLCQDLPYSTPSPWDLLEIEILTRNDTKADLIWKWGDPAQNLNSNWKDFEYRFQVVKECGDWKISYLQGFDFKESTRTDTDS